MGAKLKGYAYTRLQQQHMKCLRQLIASLDELS